MTEPGVSRARDNSAMLRITELRLPLDHAEDALRPAIVARLGDAVDAAVASV